MHVTPCSYHGPRGLLVPPTWVSSSLSETSIQAFHKTMGHPCLLQPQNHNKTVSAQSCRSSIPSDRRMSTWKMKITTSLLSLATLSYLGGTGCYCLRWHLLVPWPVGSFAYFCSRYFHWNHVNSLFYGRWAPSSFLSVSASYKASRLTSSICAHLHASCSP